MANKTPNGAVNNIPNSPTNNMPLDQINLINKILDTQNREINLREQEIAFKKQQIDNNLTFSTNSIEKQLQDRQQQRTHEQIGQKNSYIFLGVVILLFLLFISWALHLNKDIIAMEIIKALGFFIAGATSGYSYGKVKELTNKTEQQK